MQMQMRHSILITSYFDLQPADNANATAQRLCHSLLCRKSNRKRCSSAAAVTLFGLGKNPRDKPLSVTFDGITDAGNFN